MEIPPEEEQGRVQSQHRASRARRPVFQLSAAIVGATVVVGLVIYLTVTVQDPQARSIFEFVLLLFCIPLAVALLLSLLRGVFERSGNVGSDFARFDMDFWSAVKALDARNQRRQDALQDLNEWRNAIAHQDWAKVGGSPTLRLRTVRVCRSTCRALARSFDRAVRAHLTTMVGRSPR